MRSILRRLAARKVHAANTAALVAMIDADRLYSIVKVG